VDLQEASLRRATVIEKLLLSLPPFIERYHLWLSHGDMLGEKYVDI